jgi:hypothetical protein
VRAYDRVHALELIERGVHFQIRETFESAIAFGRAALLELGLSSERAAEVEEDVRQRDRDRFALQQQGNDRFAGSDRIYVRPVPRPEPFTVPRRQAVALHPGPRDEPAADPAPNPNANPQ